MACHFILLSPGLWLFPNILKGLISLSAVAMSNFYIWQKANRRGELLAQWLNSHIETTKLILSRTSYILSSTCRQRSFTDFELWADDIAVLFGLSPHSPVVSYWSWKTPQYGWNMKKKIMVFNPWTTKQVILQANDHSLRSSGWKFISYIRIAEFMNSVRMKE